MARHRRRRAVGAAAAAALLSPLHSALLPCSATDGDANAPHYDAVVVGAGWAGLRAARTLVDAGVSSLLVLEANDFVGGRSKALNWDGSYNSASKLGDESNVPIDMGSEWIYSYNEMEDALLDGGLLDYVELYGDLDGYLDLSRARYYVQSRQNGEISTRAISDGDANELRERVWGGYLNFRENLLRREGAQSVHEAVERYKDRLTSNRDVQYLNLVADTGEIDYTGQLSELNLGDYRWFYEAGCSMDYLAIPGVGYGNIAAKYAEPFQDKIKLGAAVTTINYEDGDNTIVTYTNKGGKERKVSAKTVLVTASLGVLKAGTISFVPPLPEWKQEVIDGMGFGVMNKCIMLWDDDSSIVWPMDRTWFGLVTVDDENSGRWTTFFNPSDFKGIPILVAWIGGDEALAMEAQTDDEVLDDVMTNLRSMFPSITRPDRVVVTRWGQEEHVRGTYCYKPVGRNYQTDSRQLRRNVGHVRFAGEATHQVWYGTTFGGWESGEQEARDMAREIRNWPTPSPVVATMRPTEKPTEKPTNKPTEIPTEEPTENPTGKSLPEPAEEPVAEPVAEPDAEPADANPSEEPDAGPVDVVVLDDVPVEAAGPTKRPSYVPTVAPALATASPEEEPMEETLQEPTDKPVAEPDVEPNGGADWEPDDAEPGADSDLGSTDVMVLDDIPVEAAEPTKSPSYFPTIAEVESTASSHWGLPKTADDGTLEPLAAPAEEIAENSSVLSYGELPYLAVCCILLLCGVL